VNTLKTYREQANRQNFHVLNSYRQHAARLYDTMHYVRSAFSATAGLNFYSALA